jgi:hypothetical protein
MEELENGSLNNGYLEKHLLLVRGNNTDSMVVG